MTDISFYMKWVRPTLRVNDAELRGKKASKNRSSQLVGEWERPTWSCKQFHRGSPLYSPLHCSLCVSTSTLTIINNINFISNIKPVFLFVFLQRKVFKTDWQTSDYTNWKENGVKLICGSNLYIFNFLWELKVLKSQVCLCICVCVLSSWRYTLLKCDITTASWLIQYLDICDSLPPQWAATWPQLEWKCRTEILAGKLG